MPEITIQGKQYKTRSITWGLFQKISAIERRMTAAIEKLPAPQAEKEYSGLWLEYCGAFLEGDVSPLDKEKISAEEGIELMGFFVSCSLPLLQKAMSMRQPSTDSPPAA